MGKKARWSPKRAHHFAVHDSCKKGLGQGSGASRVSSQMNTERLSDLEGLHLPCMRPCKHHLKELPKNVNTGGLRVDGAWLLALKLLALPGCYELLLQRIQRLLLLQQLGLHLLHLPRVALGHCALMVAQDCHLSDHTVKACSSTTQFLCQTKQVVYVGSATSAVSSGRSGSHSKECVNTKATFPLATCYRARLPQHLSMTPQATALCGLALYILQVSRHRICTGSMPDAQPQAA